MQSLEGKKFSFGVGRELMQPLHVDHVIRRSAKHDQPPSAIYNLPKTFGKVGLQKSLQSKDKFADFLLNK